MRTRLIIALVATGVLSMAAQILMMRELLVVFYGNELSFGLTLASWLLWIAAGSGLFGRLYAHRCKDTLGIFIVFSTAAAFLVPATLVAIRCIPAVFHFSPGEIIGIVAMALATFSVLAPLCMASGFLFVLGCHVYGSGQQSSLPVGHVYIFESIGATIGGFLTSIVLLKYLEPLSIAFFISAVGLVAAWLLSLGRRPLAVFTTSILAVFLIIGFAGGFDSLKRFSLARQWEGHELVASEDSVYGNVAITKREGLYSVFINGLYDFTVPDELTSERNAHFPLLEHASPKNVLLIGGGSSGILARVLQHPLERVDYVELDPLIIRLVRRFLPKDRALDDPRVSTITDTDGRLFIKRTSRSYDVVMLNLPEPHTAQLNRFYTKEFFREARSVLRPGGIISFYLSAGPNYVSEERLQLYATLKKTLEAVFTEVRVTPGETNYFLATDAGGTLTLDWRVLMNRLKERGIATRYMRDYYLFSELSAERIDSFDGRLAQAATATLNTDFHPVAYYYDLVLWSSFFKYSLKNFFTALSPRRIAAVIIAFYLILLGLLLPGKAQERIRQRAVLACMAASGFAEISFQVLTLIVFQMLYGYVYYKLGFILTSYMLGLIFGGWLSTRLIAKGLIGYRAFVVTQAAIVAYPLMLVPLFFFFGGARNELAFWFGSNIVFPFLPVIAGFIGGFQFPLANDLYIRSGGVKASYAAGLIYGLDLFGSCCGAVLTSVFLIPMIGIPMTCAAVAGLNLVGLLALLKGQKR